MWKVSESGDESICAWYSLAYVMDASMKKWRGKLANVIARGMAGHFALIKRDYIGLLGLYRRISFEGTVVSYWSYETLQTRICDVQSCRP